MDIKYLGHASFLIKGRVAKLVTDPFDPKMVGLKYPKQEADIVTVSHTHGDHNNIGQIASPPTESLLVIDWPGQFEKKGMRVIGYKSYHDKKQGAERGENILYKIEDDLTVLHCGDLGVIPDDKFLDEIGDVDILLIGTGGETALEPEEAVELVKKIEPSIVIPMHYNTSGHDQKIWKGKAPVEDFLKKIGAENIQPIAKLSVKKEELGEEMKVVVMEIVN